LLVLEVKVKLDEEKGLISNGREEIVFSNEVKDISTSPFQEIREREGGLAIQNVPVDLVSNLN
jgi:hypothetical protein